MREFIPCFGLYDNDENSLSSVLSIAYMSAMQYYFQPVRELPLGRGFADFVFIPKEQYAEYYPALLVELKWNKNAETALQQIKEKKYPESLQIMLMIFYWLALIMIRRVSSMTA